MAMKFVLNEVIKLVVTMTAAHNSINTTGTMAKTMLNIMLNMTTSLCHR